MRRIGTALPREVLRSLREYGEWFDASALELGCSAGPGGGSVRLDRLIERRERFRTLAPALELLTRTATLQGSGEEAETAARAVRQEASQLMETLRIRPDDPIAETLLDGTHPLALLAGLLDGEDLDDANWGRAYDAVAETYGRAAAIAAARHRLAWGLPANRGNPPIEIEVADETNLETET